MPSSPTERCGAGRMTPEQRRARAALAAKSRYSPDDPTLDDDRRDLRALTLEEHVRRVVDQAPPLTSEQRQRIAALLQPAPMRETA